MTTRCLSALAAMSMLTAVVPPSAGECLDIELTESATVSVAEPVGSQYAGVFLHGIGNGKLIFSAENRFTGDVTNQLFYGVLVADVGVGIPSTASHVFVSGTYAPLTQSVFTSPLGSGPGTFDMSIDHFKIAALNGPLTVNFGGNAEPVVAGGPMNPNNKYFHFGWKNDNNEFPITVSNPLQLSPKGGLTLRSCRNAPVTLEGGVSVADGATGRLLNMPSSHPHQFRFTAEGTLNIPGNSWFAHGGGTTIFDGGEHSCGPVTNVNHTIVFTNAATFVTDRIYLGRESSFCTGNLYAYDSNITCLDGNVRLGSNEKARGNWYMKGGKLFMRGERVEGLPVYFLVGDMATGAFYQESGDVDLYKTEFYVGYNTGYTGFYRIDGGTFSSETLFRVGAWGTGTVEVVEGKLDIGNTFTLGHEGSAVGRFRMSGGTLAYNANAMIGRRAIGYLLLSGGEMIQTTDNEFSLGRFATGKGRMDITGGSFKDLTTINKNGRYIGWEGTGVVSVAGSGLFSTANTIYLGAPGYSAAYGEINLREGGLFEAKRIEAGSGRQKITTDGGTFRVHGGADNVAFFTNAEGLDETYVGRRGVTFDTGDYTAEIGNFALDGRSPGKIRKVGSGKLIMTGLPQTGGGIEVNEGTVALASGATVGAPFAISEGNGDVGDNSYPDNPSASLVAQNYLLHRWSFNHGSVVDSIANNVATVHDDVPGEPNIAFKDDVVALAGGTVKVPTRYLDLGEGLFGEEDGEFTVEFWARVYNWTSGTKIVTIGNSGSQEIFWNTTGAVCARGQKDGEGWHAFWENTSPAPGGTMCHFAIVIGKATDGKRDVTFSIRNRETGEKYFDNKVCEQRTYSPIAHQDRFAFAYSYHGESDTKLDIDEVRIWKAALSDEQLKANVLLGPDTLPLLDMKSGSGPLAVASSATFDLGGNTISYPGLAGAGTVRNGAVTVETLNVTRAMRLECDVTVTGEISFADGASLVTAGTLDLAGATVKCAYPATDNSLVLASAEDGGRIVGVPAKIDLGANRKHKFLLTGSKIALVKTGFAMVVR